MLHPRMLSAWSLELLFGSSLVRQDGRGACQGRSTRKRTTQRPDDLDRNSFACSLAKAARRGRYGPEAQPLGTETEHSSSEQAERILVFAGKTTHSPGRRVDSGSELVGEP